MVGICVWPNYSIILHHNYPDDAHIGTPDLIFTGMLVRTACVGHAMVACRKGG